MGQAGWAVYGYRSSCSKFPYVSSVVRAVEPVSVSDSLSGEGAYSIQFNIDLRDGGWAQGAFQFFKTFTAFQLYEWMPGEDPNKPLQDLLFSSNDPKNPLPFLPDQQNCDFIIAMEDTGTDLILFASILLDIPGIPERELWSTSLVFRHYGEMMTTRIAIVGMGGGSTATFSSGKFLCNILTTADVQDLTGEIAVFLPSPTTSTPCQPFLVVTSETSNLEYYIDNVTPNAIDAYAVLPEEYNSMIKNVP